MFGAVGLLALVGLLATIFEDDGGTVAETENPEPVEPEPNQITGGPDGDTLVGTLDIDIIEGNGGDDTISGLAGDDTLAGGAGQDIVRGGEGNDTVLGGNGSDDLEGGSGNDFIDGGGNSDNIRGGSGDDLVLGGNGGDTIQGDGGDDLLLGGAGNDLIAGGAGNDTVFGGDGDDDLRGGVGDDFLDGFLGADVMSGGQGNDILSGAYDTDGIAPFGPLDDDAGDTMVGNEGNDFFFIGSADTATGGEGDDTFATGTFVRPGEAGVVTDFNSEEDAIQLHYDGAAGPAPAVTVVTNADGSASILMGEQIVLTVTTPGDLAAVDIVLVNTLTFDAAAPAVANPVPLALEPEAVDEEAPMIPVEMVVVTPQAPTQPVV